jgi:hypothetical protein
MTLSLGQRYVGTRTESSWVGWLEYLDQLLNTDEPDQLEDVDKIGNLEDLEPAE